MSRKEKAKVALSQVVAFDCPYCGRDKLDRSLPMFPDGYCTIVIRVTCGSCGKQWHDVYHLVKSNDVIIDSPLPKEFIHEYR